MGTMLQAQGDLDLQRDFQGLEGCNEVLNITRPDVVSAVHRAYLEAGSDCVETNTFGTNLAALAEYGIVDRLAELASAGARIARATADEFSDKPRFVLGSVGPGTKLPSLGHVAFAEVRDAYQAQVEAMIAGGIDAVQIETCQDLLQAKAAVIATKRARTKLGVDLPILVNVTVETTGTMLLGSEIGAARSTLEALGVDVIGLNCATGPAEMSEHLRYLSRTTSCGIGATPNAGLPDLPPDGARPASGIKELTVPPEISTLSTNAPAVWACLENGPRTRQQIVEATRLSPRQVTYALKHLEEAGFVEKDGRRGDTTTPYHQTR